MTTRCLVDTYEYMKSTRPKPNRGKLIYAEGAHLDANKVGLMNMNSIADAMWDRGDRTSSSATVSVTLRRIYDRLIDEMELPDDVTYVQVEAYLMHLKDNGDWTIEGDEDGDE